jgi:V/A-type H+-transporting ATPase subunit A
MGAVSPPGGDLSDPVVQATLRVVGAFWSLEDKLAYRRHFPAINWLTSYSLYLSNLEEYFRTEIGEEWLQMRQEAMRILEMEAELEEIVRLVGLDALSPENRLIMETARSIREDFLYQDAFHEVDCHTSFDKQYEMLDLILFFHKRAEERLKSGVNINDIARLNVREEIARARYISEENLSQFETIKQHIESQMGRRREG